MLKIFNFRPYAKSEKKLKSYVLNFLLFIIGWTVIIVFSLFWNLNLVEENIIELANKKAEASYQKDLLYRRWNANLGGVYAAISEINIPNPYLDVPERDISTPSGNKLTLINPAYMTRQVYELANQKYGIIGHMTSLNTIRPKNTPDDFEREGLESFTKAEDEFKKIVEIDNKYFLRYLRPFMVEKGCLKCHAKQGYKLGDVRGGISINIPMDGYYKASASQKQTLWIGHIIIWFVGFLFINQGFRSIHKNTDSLIRSEKRFRVLFNSINDIVLVYQSNSNSFNKIIEVNKTTCDVLGFSKSELLGKSTTDIIQISPDKNHFESTAYTKRGESIPVEINTRQFEFNNKLTTLAIARDITKRKKVAEELKIAKEIAEAGNKAKSDFLANMSHELRTPLNSIIGFTGIVLMGLTGDLNDEQKKQLTMIKNSAYHLLNLINDILDISKIEAGKTEMFPDEFYIDDVIQEVIDTVTPVVNDKGIELLKEIPEKTLILSDKKSVKQILMNLVSNGVKFTEQGSVTIKSRVLKNEHLQVRVIDTGIGIKKEDMDKLFGFFQQVDMSSTKKYEGTGLGLYLSKKLVTLLGGEMTVKSKFGKGSEFTFTLPLKYKETK
jgi:PAS domain S-box-containing protein